MWLQFKKIFTKCSQIWIIQQYMKAIKCWILNLFLHYNDLWRLMNGFVFIVAFYLSLCFHSLLNSPKKFKFVEFPSTINYNYIISRSFLICYFLWIYFSGCEGNPHAKRLYDDLLHDYNRLIRPVPNFTETLTVRLGLKLSQLIDVDLKNQVMTTNVWVDQVF